MNRSPVIWCQFRSLIKIPGEEVLHAFWLRAIVDVVSVIFLPESTADMAQECYKYRNNVSFYPVFYCTNFIALTGDGSLLKKPLSVILVCIVLIISIQHYLQNI